MAAANDTTSVVLITPPPAPQVDLATEIAVPVPLGVAYISDDDEDTEHHDDDGSDPDTTNDAVAPTLQMTL